MVAALGNHTIRDLSSAILHGLTGGDGYAAVALPFVLVARATGVFNFAYATTVIFAGIGAASMLGTSPGTIEWLGIILIWIAIGVGLGVATYFLAVLKVEKTSALGGSHLTLVTTLAVGLIIETAAYNLWGESPPPIPSPLHGQWHVYSDVYLSHFSVLFALAVVLVGGLLDRWLNRSNTGLLWRAMGEDRVLAESRGINSKMWATIIFGWGGALASFAGVGLAVQTPYTPFSGLQVGLNAFLVLGIVGVESLGAAVAGGLLLGVVESLLQLAVGSALRDVLVIVLVAVVLACRPKGIFGRVPIREV